MSNTPTTYRAIDSLHNWEHNPRTATKDGIERLIKQIKKLGVYKPLLITEDGTVLGGNMRLKALQEMGEKKVWVSVVQADTEEKKIEYALSDNDRVGKYEGDQLANLIGNFPEVEWGDYAVDIKEPELITDLMDSFKETVEDEVPEVSTEPAISKQGEIYQLGRHRVMCGDSTKIEDVEKLMDGKKADIGFTSPPYNAGQTPTEVKMGKDSKYLNDNDDKEDDEYFDLLIKSTDISNKYTEYNFINLQMLSGNKIPLLDFIYNYKNKLADIIIWNKLTAQPAMAENVLNSQFEFVIALSDKGNRHIGTKRFRGTLSNVVDISKQTKNKIREHNATFPVEFAGHFVKNFSTDSVLDIFLGSGSTLIACEQTNRICYGMELDPKYVDVIRKRYAKFINKEAEWEKTTPKI